ncbi:MAG: type I DNA topoisomerase [Rikenellaceae bacterium]
MQHKNLIIVESPAKAKTIEKFLGKDFIVKSSFGHIRDLSKKKLGIDVENGFLPVYEVSADKKKVVAELEELANKAETVWLASDEDREGEAIAWHIAQVLGLDVESTKRIVFHEITKNAILNAVENPRTIDMNFVNAQQARRILDRLVGFELSPVLWKKVKPSLSAGRVQSVAVRLIVDREREVLNFEAKPFYRVVGNFVVTDDKGVKFEFTADLPHRLKTKAEAQKLLEKCSDATFTIDAVTKKPAKKSPAAPFTTSTLQQEASRKLSMSVSQTMSTAQRLYEAGYITYMRTDSVNLSSQAVAAAKQEIVKLFGEKYSEPRKFKTKTKGAQEAHEAIRPSYMDKRTVEGSAQEKKLYDLIWKRTVASQMASASIEKTTVDIHVDDLDEKFVATGEVVLFDGFMHLYFESTDDESSEGTAMLPALKQGDKPLMRSITATERFTQSPARYSEAALVRSLEELGIGRPSTYAPTISTVITRGYIIRDNRDGVKREYEQLKVEKGKSITSKTLTETVGKEKNKLFPTDIGIVVTDFLSEQFPDILDFNFTAKVEKEFDEVASGNMLWDKMIEQFYGSFHDTVDKVLETAMPQGNQARLLGVDPKSGKNVYVKIGRFGPVAQIGETNDEQDKPRYAAMKKDQLIQSITLEQALDLFGLPRNVGVFEEKDVVIGVGRFGPYVRHDGKFVSLDKTDDPYTITLERAVELVENKRAKDLIAKTPIQSFEASEITILIGRYGPYIACKGKNYRIPKGSDPAAITEAECLDVIAKSKK